MSTSIRKNVHINDDFGIMGRWNNGVMLLRGDIQTLSIILPVFQYSSVPIFPVAVEGLCPS
jgi:hypothetical protein